MQLSGWWRGRVLVCLAVVAWAALAAPSAWAGGFGPGGRLILPLPPHVDGQLMANATVDHHSRTVMIGVEVPSTPPQNLIVRRILPNGRLDHTFGRYGQRTFHVRIAPVTLAVAPDGKIVVIGAAPVSIQDQTTFAVMRLRRNGRPDASFGHDGIVKVHLPATIFSAEPKAVTITPKGGIVIVGEADLAPAEPRLAVVRITPTGHLFSGFRGHGFDIFYDFRLVASAVHLDAEKRIVIASSGFIGDQFLALRLTRRGRLDTTFGERGIAVFTHHNPAGTYGTHVCSVLVQRNGDLVVVGTAVGTTADATNEFTLVRFTPQGRVDPSFGNDGLVQTVFVPSPGPTESASIEQAVSAFLRGDGRIVVGGTVDVFHNRGDDFGVAEYLPSGRLNPDFHDHGLLLIDFHSNYDNDVATRPLTKHSIVMVGYNWGAKPRLARVTDP
jgi:uncharacterized delta-60 repeat protein